MTNVDAIKVQEYAVKNNLTFEQAGKALGFSPEMVEEMQAGLNNDANWGNVEDKTEFSQKHEVGAEDILVEQQKKKAKLDSRMRRAGDEMSSYFKKGMLGEAARCAAEGVGYAFQLNTTPDDPRQQKAGLGGLAIAALLAVAVFATSCVEGDDIDNSNITYNEPTTINISIKQEDKAEIIAAMNKGFDALEKKLDELGYKFETYGAKIVELLVENNSSLKTISDQLKDLVTKGEKSIESVIELLTNIDNTTTVIESLLADISVDNKDIKDEVADINKKLLNLNTLAQGVEDLKALLVKVLENQDNSYNVQLQAGVDIKAILAKLEKINVTEKNPDLSAILEILNDIKGITQNIDNKLGDIQTTINDIKVATQDNKKIEAALDKLLQLVQQNNDKADVTNSLLEKLLNMYNGGNSGDGCGISEADFAKLLELIAKNGDKIDETNRLLAKIQNENADFQKVVLEAIAQLGIDAQVAIDKILDAIDNNTAETKNIKNYVKEILEKLDKMDANQQESTKKILNAIANLDVNSQVALDKILKAINANTAETKDIKNLVQKILEKLDTMDANQQEGAKKILNAIAKIKVTGGEGGQGGTVDLSALEDMMAELLKLVKGNNNLLTSIDGKLDLINMTVKAAEDKITKLLGDEFGKNEARFNKLMEAIKGIKTGDFDDTQLMNKLDLILNVLEKIGNKQYDDTELMNKLDAIIDLIKNHEVEVVVDVTGKVSCECNCGGGTHEGVLGDLNDILG